jgi:DNA-binding XRE family transcriptional regulator
MGYTNINYLNDENIIKEIGLFIKKKRISQNKTQAQLAKDAGLNRWTLGQIERGESINISSLIQVLRSIDALDFLGHLQRVEEPSPIEYAKQKRKTRQRVRNPSNPTDQNDDLGW